MTTQNNTSIFEDMTPAEVYQAVFDGRLSLDELNELQEVLNRQTDGGPLSELLLRDEFLDRLETRTVTYEVTRLNLETGETSTFTETIRLR